MMDQYTGDASGGVTTPMPEHDPGRSVLANAIAAAFGKYEDLGVRVGSMWLHPQQMLVLASDPCFDINTHREITLGLSASSGGTFWGWVYGANAFSSDKVPLNHVGLIPDDFKAELIGGAGCIPL